MSKPKTLFAADVSWMDRSACRFYDLGIFYTRSESAEATREAKDICFGCPVVQACLMYALRTPEDKDHGVWGATSARERRELRREADLRRARREAS